MAKIYLDNAATTQISDSVFEAMIPWLREKYGNPSSLHSYGREAARAIDEARRTCAECLNCSPDEIIFTSGGTESNNTAIKSAVGRKRKSCLAVISDIEHHAVSRPLDTLKATDNVVVSHAMVTIDGVVSFRCMEILRACNPDFVSIMAVNNEIGTIQPITEIGTLCRERGIIFHTDAVQAIGNIPVDVQKMKVDMLSLSGHKIHAPKGIGLLYVRKSVPFMPLIEGGGQQQNRRSGTENVAAIVGLAQALKDATQGVENKAKRLKPLQDKLIDGLIAIEGVRLNGDRKHIVPSICNFTFDGVLGETLMLKLDLEGICVSTGSACTAGSLESSHVLKAIGLTDEQAHSSVRFSMSEYTTEEEIDRVLEVVPRLVKEIRNYSK